MIRLALLAWITLGIAGCHKDPAPSAGEPRPAPTVDEPQAPMSDLVLFDQKGKVVARCELALPENAAGNSDFAGTWRLLSYSSRFPRTSASSSGRYAGHAKSGRLSIDLNPGVMDSNVVLDGKIEDGKFAGEWMHATVAGGAPKGTFEMELAK